MLPWLVSCPAGPQPGGGEHLILVPAGQALRAPAALGTPLPSGHWPVGPRTRSFQGEGMAPPGTPRGGGILWRGASWVSALGQGGLRVRAGAALHAVQKELRCQPRSARQASSFTWRKGPISRLLPPSPLSLALLSRQRPAGPSSGLVPLPHVPRVRQAWPWPRGPVFMVENEEGKKQVLKITLSYKTQYR